MKGYEKLPFINIEEFNKLIDSNPTISMELGGCPDSYGLIGFETDSWVCRNDYCGRCWKAALNKEYD